jgi:hypothetical protein
MICYSWMERMWKEEIMDYFKEISYIYVEILLQSRNL